MSDNPTPVDVAVAYVEAFGKHDMTTAARYVAEGIVFESPRARITGAEAYLAAVGEFAQVVTGVDIIAAFGAGDQAMVMYDLRTSQFGTLRAADHFVVRDGRITSDKLVFDTHGVRTAQAGHVPTRATVVRYETRADSAETNQGLVEEVFAQLNADDPGGLRYATFRLADGVTFVHVAVADEGADTLAQSSAFAAFQEGITDRLVAPPAVAAAEIVGSYRFLA